MLNCVVGCKWQLQYSCKQLLLKVLLLEERTCARSHDNAWIVTLNLSPFAFYISFSQRWFFFPRLRGHVCVFVFFFFFGSKKPVGVYKLHFWSEVEGELSPRRCEYNWLGAWVGAATPTTRHSQHSCCCVWWPVDMLLLCSHVTNLVQGPDSHVCDVL